MMSEFHNSIGGGEEEQIQGHCADKAERIEELCDQLTDWLARVTDDDCDMAECDRILAELDHLDPMEQSFDVQESLDHFHAKYSALFEKAETASHATAATGKGSRSRRLIRKFLPTAATLAVIFACLVTAQAMGVDVFGSFARWTDQIFSFSSEPPANQAIIQSYPLEVGEEATFASLQDAADAFGITVPIVPKEIPDYLGEPVVTASLLTSGISIRAEYSRIVDQKDCFLSIRYAESLDEAKSFAYEKDKNVLDTVYYNEIPHYLFCDKGIQKFAWTNGELECSIKGNILEQEMRDILNSIYEEVDIS